MKSSLFIAASIFLWICSFNSCSKDRPTPPITNAVAPPPVITQSFTQEFNTVFSDLSAQGWVFKDYSNPSNGGWEQGYHADKMYFGPTIAPAYSSTIGDQYNFAYAGFLQQPVVVNAWMFTPPVTLKNGDKLSFFTKCDSIGINRLEIRLNETDTTSAIGLQAGDAGKFTKLVGTVNSSSAIDGYPKTWTRFEYTITGLQGSITSRIAFGYSVTNPKAEGAIGIDLLNYQKL